MYNNTNSLRSRTRARPPAAPAAARSNHVEGVLEAETENQGAWVPRSGRYAAEGGERTPATNRRSPCTRRRVPAEMGITTEWLPDTGLEETDMRISGFTMRATFVSGHAEDKMRRSGSPDLGVRCRSGLPAKVCLEQMETTRGRRTRLGSRLTWE